ncbi:PAS domain-containing protein [Treponema pallidum]|uniref:YheO-like domain-containing protein n=2 Tax=Treponema pallidum TaxID=160 RepID=A0AAU8RM52_TREPL|nr:PAS domain-containing protein [Treponema pallidum]AEZ57499.1 hypothetical protein TPESAMD_0374b [Treponema pallidum subsp. pertenue str. SamoaD]AEZ58568.1 hypothetical protein TPECDC2_0374b [Treponema pallidum subsp. pertenue str. CDC2]AEZ59636.1 hypothetical protein TPEGAU_0374b [Treponema pallidum subsp. pertenue str. Gauthier]AEZ60700.1 hypothetical protein TPADAL_0374b [Treponema pallidum subsp. pallidum DAL-1]AGK84023.1 hypothetical protein TPFB_0374b [Treponema pallidum str. Fribourg-
MQILQQVAQGIASHFGHDCEVAVYGVSSDGKNCAVDFITNGRVTSSRVGDRPRLSLFKNYGIETGKGGSTTSFARRTAAPLSRACCIFVTNIARLRRF